jgi:CHAD domain-containing protein
LEIDKTALPLERFPQEPDPIEVSICSFAAQNLLPNSTAMQTEITTATTAADTEHIHCLRVSSRRIRTALELFQQCLPSKKGDQWRRQMRTVTRALGDTRDTDVQIERLNKIYKKLPNKKYRPGIRRLLLRQSQVREKLQHEVDTVITLLGKKRTLAQINKRFEQFNVDDIGEHLHAQGLFKMAFAEISHRLDDFLSYEADIRKAENKKELHAMRIAAKRLRYCMEIFASLYEDKLENPLDIIRKVQTILGEIHDCDVWIEFLPDFIEKENNRILKFYGHSHSTRYLKPGLEYFHNNRLRVRSRLFNQFQADWIFWRKQGVWSSLRETVKHVAFFDDSSSVVNRADGSS